MTVATLARTGPRGTVPSHGGAADTPTLSKAHDPRPLWLEPVPAESPWRSPAFWLAWLLVMPAATAVRAGRAAFR